MTATEKSEKLPISTSVDFMKACEMCPVPKIKIECAELYGGCELFTKHYAITCENKHLCKYLIETYEGIKYDGQGISEQNTNIPTDHADIC